MSFFPMKILLATDGSEEATLAARIAADLADKTGSELHVVHVRMFPFHLSYSAGSGTAEDLQRGREQFEKRARGLLDEQVKITEAAGGSVAQAHLRIGRPDAEIVHLAEEIGAGLIVIGSRGLGGTRRALMGSGSDSV